MKCSRCNTRFDESIPSKNVENYGGPAYYACPHCGKLYTIKRIVTIEPCDDCEYPSSMETDDWDNPIVIDEDYHKEF